MGVVENVTPPYKLFCHFPTKLSLSKYVGEQKQRSKKCPTIFDTHEDVLQ